jgi:hypothetical protein
MLRVARTLLEKQALLTAAAGGSLQQWRLLNIHEYQAGGRPDALRQRAERAADARTRRRAGGATNEQVRHQRAARPARVQRGRGRQGRAGDG